MQDLQERKKTRYSFSMEIPESASRHEDRRFPRRPCTALAPMATLSHEALRLLIHSFGDPDFYYSEMIHAPSLLAGARFEEFYLRAAPCPERMVWQLTSPDAGAMARAVPLVLAAGGVGVDLNMGCCAPAIVRTGAGISWMLRPLEETAAMVQGVRRALDAWNRGKPQEEERRLSVKLRLGETLSFPRLLDFCSMLAAEGVQQITLHPRLKKEKYSRPARWETVARLAESLPVPVYGNGDCFSAEDAVSLLRRFPCAGLMAGRGAVRRPWLFRGIRAAWSGTVPDGGFPPVDLLETAELFVRFLTERLPPEFQNSRARRFFFYFCDNFTFAHYVRTQVLNAATPPDMLEALRTYCRQNPQERFSFPAEKRP